MATITKQERNQVLAWLQSNRDYNQGLALYLRYGKNKVLKSRFIVKPKTMAGKLAYELSKIAKVPLSEVHKVPKVHIKEGQVFQLVEPSKAEYNKEDLDKFPKEVRRVIHEFQRLYNDRAKAHKAMRKLPANNEPQNVGKRKKISEEMGRLSERLDLLYVARVAYEKENILPDLKKLFPDEKPAADKNDPFGLKKMDGADLVKRQKNLQSSIVKDHNLLKYQGKKKLEQENPMPQGPKRQTVEKRVTLKNKELAAIKKILDARG